MTVTTLEARRANYTPNAEVIEEWAKALESGEYERGSGYLARNGKYCCLGVLCELAAKAGVADRTDSGLSDGAKRYDGNSSTLPVSVMEWAGLDLPSPTLRYVDNYNGTSLTRESDCVYENDAQGRSFPEIAAMVRNTYLSS